MRRIVRAAVRPHDLRQGDVVALADLLWSAPVHERRMAAVDVLDFRVAKLDDGDLAFIERLIRESRTWALVDALAIGVTGAVVVAHPAAGRSLDQWVADADFWLRRAALLALIPGVRGGLPDLPRIAAFSDALLEEQEFFIRKAIGWLLREQAKKDPGWVTTFLEPRTDRASGLTIREATKPLRR